MTPTLSVARDAFLESATIADVLELARTMALERLARGLPVAWVEPVEPSATVLHTWLAVQVGLVSTPGADWVVWRDGWRHTSTADGTRHVVTWKLRTVAGRIQRAACVLDGDATRAAWGA